MNKRPYGNTGKTVSEIGVGAWQLGNAIDWSKMHENEAIKLVHKALELGGNFFDTAPNYGLGSSEELLGKALKGKRESVVINTKFGHHSNGQLDFDADKIRPSLEGSLKRLQTDYVDSIILHNPPFEILGGKTKHYEVLEKLKEEGKIGAYGVSVDSSGDMFEAMKNENIQVMEVMFNIFHQETARAFKAAEEKNIGLIIKVPLDSGWLSGKYDENSTFEGIRTRWSPEVIRRRAELLGKIKFITENGTTMVQAALRFILAFPQVSTVIPGARNIAQLEENFSAGNARMNEDTIKRLQHLWETEIKENGLPW